VYLNQQCVI